LANIATPAPPDLLAGLRGPYFKGAKEGEGERKGEKMGKEREQEGPPPPLRKFLDPPQKATQFLQEFRAATFECKAEQREVE